MLLKEFEFGYADASKEYIYAKDLFDLSFHDPNDYIDKLINGNKYMVVGRKGVGKTAILSKIKFITDKQEDNYSEVLSLSNLEYNTFKKTKIDKDVQGSNKYKRSWEFLLLLSIVKQFYKSNSVENELFLELVGFLESIGININDAKIKSDVTFLSKLKLGTNIHIFKAELEKDFSEDVSDYSFNIGFLIEKIKEVLETIHLPDYKLFLLIDGLDDVLRYKVDQHEIIKGLIRAIDELNIFLYELDVYIKIILSVREDILNELNDPDMNKIKRDGSINVDWRNKQGDLMDLVRKRLIYSGLPEAESHKYFENLFSLRMGKKYTWDYIFDRTLFKPRDILQFFITCQDIYPENDRITKGELKDCIKRYSNDYLIEEMKDELSGFIEDEYIQILPEIFKQIGNKDFKINDFSEFISEQIDISQSKVNNLITLLYSAGYIGQLIRSKDRTSVQFKYRNPGSRLDFGNNLILHYGIKAGLGIAL